MLDAHTRGRDCCASTPAGPRRGWSCPGRRTLYVTTSWTARSASSTFRPLVQGLASAAAMGTLATMGNERLRSNVLRGKQFFYDARDTRLARDRYMSCATCRNEGGHDGRVWDLRSQGEGLRNTVDLRGRGGAQGFLHWSNNFDEVQDLEGQIRTLAGGSGLMSDADFNSGTRNQPLGAAKAGVCGDLDALAAYVASLNSRTRVRSAASNGALSPLACRGQGGVHGAQLRVMPQRDDFTRSAPATRTTSAPSGRPAATHVRAARPHRRADAARRLGHRPVLARWICGDAGGGRSKTHRNHGRRRRSPAAGGLPAQIGSEESSAPAYATGGLSANYFNNTTLTGTPVLSRTEAVNLELGHWSAQYAVNTDNFSARWVGSVIVPASGNYQLSTISDDGVRLWVNAARVINNWTNHAARADTSAVIPLVAGQRVPVTLEYYEKTGKAVIRLQWLVPGTTTFVAIPASSLSAN